MSVNYSQLADLHVRSLIVDTYNELGDDGVHALKDLVSALRDVYSQRPADLMPSDFVVVRPLSTSAMPAHPGYTDVAELDTDSPVFGDSFTIGVFPDGQYRVWSTLPLSSYSHDCLVYRISGTHEEFWLRSKWKPVPTVLPGHRSSFSIPTFTDVESALDDYASRYVRRSTCEKFSECWEDAGARMFLVPGPEHIMRDSLYRYLRAVFKSEVEVQREQNVDATQPVDIRLTWTFSPVRVLIEIKWLGKSRSNTGRVVSYYERRATEGAKQLFDYLQTYAQTYPNAAIRGYLVVIDARRRGLGPANPLVSKADAWHYQHSDIVYDPDYSAATDMYRPARRMYSEPA